MLLKVLGLMVNPLIGDRVHHPDAKDSDEYLELRVRWINPAQVSVVTPLELDGTQVSRIDMSHGGILFVPLGIDDVVQALCDASKSSVPLEIAHSTAEIRETTKERP